MTSFFDKSDYEEEEYTERFQESGEERSIGSGEEGGEEEHFQRRGEGGEEGEEEYIGEEKYGGEHEQYEAEYSDLARVSNIGLGEGTNVAGSLTFIQKKIKSPYQRFAEKFSAVFIDLNSDSDALSYAKSILEQYDGAEYLSPTYSAASIDFILEKLKKGNKLKLNSSDTKSLELYTEKNNFNIIDMVRYIRIIEKHTLTRFAS